MNTILQENTSYKKNQIWTNILSVTIILIMAIMACTFHLKGKFIIISIPFMLICGIILWNLIKTINTTYTYFEDFQALYNTNKDLISQIQLQKPTFDSDGFLRATLNFQYNNIKYECYISNENDYTNLMCQLSHNK